MKNFIKIAFMAAFAAIAGYGVYTSLKSDIISDLALANVEALASGNEYDSNIWERYYRPEGDGYNCTKTGKETC